jgi:hypothetical protein
VNTTLPRTSRADRRRLARHAEQAESASVRGALSSLDTRRARALAALGVVSSFAWLALQQSAHSADVHVELEISALPSAPARCRAQADQAHAHARLLEQLASAAWERVPFDPHESPRAVAQVAEAEVCFAAAHDRVGRTRSAGLRSRYAADLERRVAHARLLLRVAMRDEELRARAPSTQGVPLPSRRVSGQVSTLLALLERAQPEAQAYRAELEQLARRYSAEPQPATGTKTALGHGRTQPGRTP